MSWNTCRHQIIVASSIASLLSLVVGVGCTSMSQRRLSEKYWSLRLMDFAKQSADHGLEDDAIECLQQVLRKAPENLAAHQQLAEAYRQAGQIGLAIRQLELAIATTHAQHDLHVELGRLYRDQGRVEEARNQVNLAIQQNPELGSAWELKGDLAAKDEKWSEAIMAYQRASSLDPRKLPILEKLVSAFMETNQPLRALSTMEQYLAESTLANRDPALLKLYGRILHETGNLKRAGEVLELACRHPEAGCDAFFQFSHVQLLRGQSENARATLWEAQRRFPDEPLVGQVLSQFEAALANAVIARHAMQPD